MEIGNAINGLKHRWRSHQSIAVLVLALEAIKRLGEKTDNVNHFCPQWAHDKRPHRD